jgi:ABC transport system ATP-binding/permease protein
MNVLSAESLSKQFNEKVLFDGLTFGLTEGDKIALVGANGVGKTTLLRTLAGQIVPDTGGVARKQGLRWAYLPQQPELDPTKTVEELLFSADNEIATTVREYEKAINDPDCTEKRMTDLLEKMEHFQAWDYDTRMKTTLGKLGITDLSQNVSTLSGGQRKRVALAGMLLQEPELIMLDEPTNHLDLEAIEWLENYLRSAAATLLMITHDRYFLDAVCSEVAELHRGKIFRYAGKYANYLENRAEREANEQVRLERARNLYTKELEWMRRQPKARSTKAKYRVEAFEQIKEEAHVKLGTKKIELQVEARRQGGKVLEVAHLTKQIGDKVLLDDFSYIFQKRDRVGIVGRNGIGKSSFLNMLTGGMLPDSGEIDWGMTTKPGYYAQEVDNLNLEGRIIDEVKSLAEVVKLADGREVSVAKLLEMFLFPPGMQHGPVAKLSGGEKRRLQLLKVLVSSPNFLILDEPTNDLDLDTLAVLEDFLQEFGGCLMLVSHDRYFMDRLVEHLFVFEGEGVVRDYPGNYSAWREDADALKEQAAMAPKQREPIVAVSSETANAVRKLSFKEQKELESAEQRIASLEQERDTLHETMASNSDFTSLEKATKRLKVLEKELEDLTSRWMELAG